MPVDKAQRRDGEQTDERSDRPLDEDADALRQPKDSREASMDSDAIAGAAIEHAQRPLCRNDRRQQYRVGLGQMRLDDVEIELRKDVTVYVPRGVKHRAWGNLKVLVVCIPRGVLHDVHEIE